MRNVAHHCREQTAQRIVEFRLMERGMGGPAAPTTSFAVLDGELVQSGDFV